MATQVGETRPYAAPSNVIAVVQRARTRNRPENINNEFLRIAGIPEAVYGRVLQALRFLELIHEDGRPTDTFRALAAAPDSQYRDLLAGVIRHAYRAEFEVVDPEQDLQQRILDAFHPYQPRSQTARMVMLFLGLCREAGIPVRDAPRERRMADGAYKRPRSGANGNPPRRQQEQPPGTSSRVGEREPTKLSGFQFGVSEDDLAVLSEEDFTQVWTALGRLARARAQARRAQVAEGAAYTESGEAINVE